MKRLSLVASFAMLAACGSTARSPSGDSSQRSTVPGGSSATTGGPRPLVDPPGTEFRRPDNGGGENGDGASTLTLPAASDLEVTGHTPEDKALIEHYVQNNAVAFQMRVRRGFCPGNVDNPNTCRGGADDGDFCNDPSDCAAGGLTFSSGETEYFDGDGNSLDVLPFDYAAFAAATDLNEVGRCAADATIFCTKPGEDDSASCGAMDPTCNALAVGEVPAPANILIRNPAELVAHNLVPAQAEMRICFAEFDTMMGCDPLVIRQDVEEYRVPPGPTYIYPLLNPDDAGGLLSQNFGHEPANHHRGPANQRHAYDIGVDVGGDSGVGTECDVMNGVCVGGVRDGDACDEHKDCKDNANGFIYGEPIVAMAAGTIVAILHDFPDNPIPGEKLPGVNGCDVRACVNPVDCDMPGEIPTTGNSVFIQFDNGEITHYAHTIPGTNNAFDCGDPVSQGEIVGNVGNSGNSGGPHLHFGNIVLAEFWDGANYSTPSYYTNVQFAAGPDPTQRRQLDIGLRNGTKFSILPPPTPLAANAAAGPGAVAESEPNDTLGTHDTLAIPATVSATLEMANVGDLAVRGDGIEDVYRVDLGGPDALRVALTWTDGAKNLDVYALTQDLRVLNETGQGTQRSGTEEAVCLELDPGAYHFMVTNFDPTKGADEPYTLEVTSDPQTISAAITNAVQPIEVDTACEATVEFEIAIHDNCCLDPETLELQVGRANPTNNATVGAIELDPLNVIGPRDISVTGRFTVSDLTSCPAEIVVFAQAEDCSGNLVSTGDQGTDAFTTVVDLIPPEVVPSDEDLYCLWDPEHLYVCFEHDDFSPTVTDNCAQPPSWLFTDCTSDQPEDAPDDGDPNGDGHTVNDCVVGAGSDDVCARAERAGQDAEGRRYALEAEATDDCGNVSAAATFGHLYVPHDQNPALMCISAPGP
jgi:hypothetical protein